MFDVKEEEERKKWNEIHSNNTHEHQMKTNEKRKKKSIQLIRNRNFFSMSHTFINKRQMHKNKTKNPFYLFIFKTNRLKTSVFISDTLSYILHLYSMMFRVWERNRKWGKIVIIIDMLKLDKNVSLKWWKIINLNKSLLMVYFFPLFSTILSITMNYKLEEWNRQWNW